MRKHILENALNIFTVHQAAAVENYFDVGHVLHIHFLAGEVPSQGGYFCISFKRAYMGLLVGNNKPFATSNDSIPIAESTTEKKSVLIGIGQPIENPQDMFRRVGSVVGLQTLYSCLCLRTHPPGLLGEQAGISRAENRELGILLDIVAERGATVNLGEAIGQMVKRSPQAMKNFSNEQGDIDWNIVNKCIHEELIRVFRILFVGDALKVFMEPSIYFKIQIIQTLLCPSKFPIEFATVIHNEVKSAYEKETEDQEGCRDPHPEAGRLLQESEESRHAVTGQRNQEVTAQTAPSHRRGGCTATHTRLGNPEDAS